MTADANHQVPVLIIGAGPVGLALASDLGWRGIECMVVEQGDGTIYHPRANTVNSRTMEFCRRWGIADQVRNAGAPPDFPPDILYLTSLQGYEIARIERPTHGGNKPLPTTPERSQRCNQLFFDPVLRALAGAFPTVTLRYKCRFESFTTGDGGVTVTVRDLASDRVETIAARYLVACCGGGSSVGKTLGVRMEGIPVLSYHLNVFLRIKELWNRHDKGKAAFYMFCDPELNHPSLIELDGDELWRLGLNQGKAPMPAQSVDVGAIVRKLIGPDIPYEVISALPWTCRSIVADRWRQGPVFLAGDAVHQHGPAGGFGMNTGLGDAVDLAWKLAAMVEGWGGPALLESYQIERRPVAKRNVDEATKNMVRFIDNKDMTPIAEDSERGVALRAQVRAELVGTKTEQYVSDGIALGYRYDDSPVVLPDGSPPPRLTAMEYVPTSRPGARAPHAFLADGRSTIDLFGQGFVLLSFNGSGAAAAALAAASASRAMPLQVVEVADAAIAALYERNLVLIRPDGHVAWRGNTAPDNPLAVIDLVRGAATAQRASAAAS